MQITISTIRIRGGLEVLATSWVKRVLPSADIRNITWHTDGTYSIAYIPPLTLSFTPSAASFGGITPHIDRAASTLTLQCSLAKEIEARSAQRPSVAVDMANQFYDALIPTKAEVKGFIRRAGRSLAGIFSNGPKASPTL